MLRQPSTAAAASELDRLPGRCDVLSRRRLLFAVLAGTLLAGPAATMAANPISVEVFVGFQCVTGTGPHNARVLVTLRTPDGQVRDRAKSSSDRFGSWLACFRFGLPTTNINGGDRLRIDVGSKTRFVVVPNLEPQIDRMADKVSGRAAPGKAVDIAITHYNGFREGSLRTYTTTGNGKGRFSVDTTNDFDLTGFDLVQIVTQSGNDLFGSIAEVPGVIVSHASNVVEGAVNPGTNVHLRLTNSRGDVRAQATAGPFGFGRFIVEMYKSNGTAAYPTARDRLTASVAADAVLQMPVSQLRGSAAEDRVSGRCPPNAKFQLLVRNSVYYGKADSNGAFVRNVKSKLDLKRGDELQLLCRFASGDVWNDSELAF